MLFISVAVLVGLLAVVTAVGNVFAPVDRARVERFATRQDLTVTTGNGSSVIRYLATTRRWRGGLLCLAVVGFGCAHLAARDGVRINFLTAFAGWFVGAVIAEWRVDELARGPQVAALLRLRRLTDYVGLRVVVLTTAVWVLVGALGVTAVVESLVRSAGRPAALATLAASALAATIIARVVRRILQRPQPLVAVDLLDADNAIRGRSLHALLGSALAIGGYLAAVEVGQVATPGRSGPATLATLVGYVAMPVLGVFAARRRRPLSTAETVGRADR